MRNKDPYPFIILILVVLSSMLVFPAAGQESTKADKEDPNFTIYFKSEALFKQGHYDEVIANLSSLSLSKFNKNQKELIFKLLSSAYFEVDNIEKGEDIIFAVYKNNPYFQQKETDDSSDLFFQNLRRFTCRPLLAASLKGGMNFPFFKVTDYYTIIDTSFLSTTNPDSFILKPSGHIALGVEYNVTWNFTVAAELYFMFESYGRKINAPGFRNTSVDYSESFGLLKIPITARYALNPKGRVVPALMAGAYFSFMTASTAEIKLETERIDGGQESNLPAVRFREMVNLRNQLNYGLTGGARLSYSNEHLKFFIEARVSYDLTNFEDQSKRYSNPKLNYEFYYVDNKSTLIIPEVSIGGSYNFYHLKRKKY